RLYRQRRDGEPASALARARRGDLPRLALGEAGLSGFARPCETTTAVPPHHARRGPRILSRGLYYIVSESVDRAAHCRRTTRQRRRARSGAHAGSRRGISALAALSEADRGAVRGSQGLARLAALQAARPRAGATGSVLDRLGPESETSGEELVARGATNMNGRPMAGSPAPRRGRELMRGISAA